MSDCPSRALLGWHLGGSSKPKTAVSALAQALITFNGRLGEATLPFLLRPHTGLVFTSRSHTPPVKKHGLHQAFITSDGPEQNGMIAWCVSDLHSTSS